MIRGRSGQRFAKEMEEFEEFKELQEFKEPVPVNGKDRIRGRFVTGGATLERCLACEAERGRHPG
jgi:hypothetical protein